METCFKGNMYVLRSYSYVSCRRAMKICVGGVSVEKDTVANVLDRGLKVRICDLSMI